MEKSNFIDCGSSHVEKKIDKLISVTSILTEEVTKEKSGNANNSEIRPVKLSSAIGKSDYSKDNIIVVDNISSPKDYHSSKQIKSELDKQNISDKAEFGYSLVKGGISLHVKNKDRVENLVKNWPQEAFGGNTIPHLPKSSTSTVNAYLRSIPVSISIQSLENSFKNSNIQFSKVHRLVYSDTQKPMPIVRVTFDNHESYETAIESDGVLIPGFKKSIKLCPARKHRVIRCPNCNRFGHVSWSCPYNHSCANLWRGRVWCI